MGSTLLLGILWLAYTADLQPLYIVWSGLIEVRHCIDELLKLEKISVRGVRCWPWRVFSRAICWFSSYYSFA